jgi:hypothetical protein
MPSVGRQAALQDADLLGEEWIGLRLIGAERAAEHDQQIGALDCRIVEIVGRRLAIRRLPAGVAQDRRQEAQILVVDVTKRNGRTFAGRHSVSLYATEQAGEREAPP